MHDRLKQRLVGVLVLLALAAVFLPMVLDFASEQRTDTATQIPSPPNIDPISIPEPTRVEGVNPGKNDEEIFQFDASRKVAEAEHETPLAGADAATHDAPKNEVRSDDIAQTPPISPNHIEQGVGLNAEGVPAAWVLQIGSFKEKPKAQAITGKLLADGHEAFIRSAAVADSTIHRVYVGPKLRRDDLLKEKAAIERKYQLKAMLLSFEP